MGMGGWPGKLSLRRSRLHRGLREERDATLWRSREKQFRQGFISAKVGAMLVCLLERKKACVAGQ